LFLDRVGFQVFFRDQREREGGLLFARNLPFHAPILSLFPGYPQTYLNPFVGQVEHFLTSEYRV